MLPCTSRPLINVPESVTWSQPPDRHSHPRPDVTSSGTRSSTTPDGTPVFVASGNSHACGFVTQTTPDPRPRAGGVTFALVGGAVRVPDDPQPMRAHARKRNRSVNTDRERPKRKRPPL